MMKKLSKYIAITLVTLCLPVTAQVSQKAFKAIYFQKPSDAPDSLFVYVNGKLMENKVTLQGRRFNTKSIPIKASSKESSVIRLTDKEITASSGDEFKKALSQYPSVTIPGSWKKFLLVAFEHKEKNTNALSMRLVAIDGDEFKEGDFRFVNMTKGKLVATLNGKEFTANSKNMVTARDFAKPNTAYRFDLTLHDRNAKLTQQKLLHSSYVFQEKVRKLIFVYKPEGKNYAKFLDAEIRSL